MQKKKMSIRSGLLAIIVLCWLVPIAIIMSLAGFLLGKSYQQSAEQEIGASANYAIRQVQLQMDEVIHDSKSVSYDGIIRSAYRDYKNGGDTAQLYRATNDYLSQQYSRRSQYKAVFISFWSEDIASDVYVMNSESTGYELLQDCKQACPAIRTAMSEADTEIKFLVIDGNLYMARNLLDSHFNTYATAVHLLDPGTIFQPMRGIRRIKSPQLAIDDKAFIINHLGKVVLQNSATPEKSDIYFSAEVDGHTFRFSSLLADYSIWRENPWIIWLVVSVSFMVLPMLIVVISIFRRQITQPMGVMARAHQLVQSGNRGYEITQESPNAEFATLYQHFNSMSSELKRQFESSILEQQASQRAQIKALQSQINPHFLNNTLEIINWEARIAENDRISNMIEALSTMLGAALDRKGRTQIPLSEELGYVDAYLYIIQVRIGDGFHVHKEIDQDVMNVLIPRLILQPIVENAVEHDITAHHGGNLWVKAYRTKEMMILDVEHDGTMTAEDEENVRILLSDDAPPNHVGLHNVSQRLKLIYGAKGDIQIMQTDRETILARIHFPVEYDQANERKLL